MARPRSGTDEAVMTILRGSPTPLTAYQVLDALRPQGVQSPPVVYRALERLERDGRVHRLEQMNAYFACHGHHGAAPAIIAICRQCRKVEEWDSAATVEALGARAAEAGFKTESRMVEVRGLCRACAAAEDGAETPAASACGHDHHHG
ncbi:Fur family transcriptional regulator [Prosthecomicrobium hirschii]|nr:transcriptional repressor [Prosthecomicrobium hirschii]